MAAMARTAAGSVLSSRPSVGTLIADRSMEIGSTRRALPQPPTMARRRTRHSPPVRVMIPNAPRAIRSMKAIAYLAAGSYTSGEANGRGFHTLIDDCETYTAGATPRALEYGRT